MSCFGNNLWSRWPNPCGREPWILLICFSCSKWWSGWTNDQFGGRIRIEVDLSRRFPSSLWERTKGAFTTTIIDKDGGDGSDWELFDVKWSMGSCWSVFFLSCVSCLSRDRSWQVLSFREKCWLMRVRFYVLFVLFFPPLLFVLVEDMGFSRDLSRVCIY